MIKFFRKIRQKLVSENKFSKYLIYAIGEIILVVIGILIALQINNWNEQKKLNKEYISDLKSIKENLEKDASNINTNLKNGNRIVQEFQELLNAGSFIVDGSSILMKLSQPTLLLDESGYNNAKRKNTLNLIQNDSLKSMFHQYYVRRYGNVEKATNSLEKLATKLKGNYLEFGNQNGSIPKKEIMSSLMQQGPFIDYLNMYNNEREKTLKQLKTMKEINVKLIAIIDNELNKVD